MSQLDGQYAVVTGGGRGIGKAIAQMLKAQGANVTIMGRTETTLAATATEINASAIVVDVIKPDAVANAFEQLPQVDILVNNAGIVQTAPFHRTDYDMWQQLFEANVTGTYLCTQAVVKQMTKRGYGRIINIASTAGLTGYAYVTAYCATKHAVIGLTRSLALELANKGVTVNAVCPGYTNTDMVSNAIDNITSKTNRTESEALAELVKHNPQKRLIQPEEVAQTVLWLCGDHSGSITGQSIAVAGGEIL